MNNGVRFTTIPKDNDTTDIMFVQKIVVGEKISLYTNLSGGSKYLYLTKKGVSYKLVTLLKETEENGKRFQYYDKKYIGTLKYLMSDRPDLFSMIDNVSLSESGISRIVVMYNDDNVKYNLIEASQTNVSKSKPNIVTFIQYSNIGYAPNKGSVIKYSYGYSAGIQLYFSRSKRHSFKLNVGYWKYELSAIQQWATMIVDYEYTKTLYGISVTYEYDFFVTQKTNVYLNLIAADAGWVNNNNYNNSGNSNSSFEIRPRLSFGIGGEFRPVERFAVFGEVNNILSLSTFPLNFSAGFKFDIGKTTKTRSKIMNGS